MNFYTKLMETDDGENPDATKYTIDDLDYLILWEEGEKPASKY